MVAIDYRDRQDWSDRDIYIIRIAGVSLIIYLGCEILMPLEFYFADLIGTLSFSICIIAVFDFMIRLLSNDG